MVICDGSDVMDMTDGEQSCSKQQNSHLNFYLPMTRTGSAKDSCKENATLLTNVDKSSPLGERTNSVQRCVAVSCAFFPK